jgi:hypothetical protein
VAQKVAGPGGETTRVDLQTDLDTTGRPAQLGRGVMTDGANTIIGRFADALAQQLASGETSAASQTAETLGTTGTLVTTDTSTTDAPLPVQPVTGDRSAPPAVRAGRD